MSLKCQRYLSCLTYDKLSNAQEGEAQSHRSSSGNKYQLCLAGEINMAETALGREELPKVRPSSQPSYIFESKERYNGHGHGFLSPVLKEALSNISAFSGRN